MSVKIFYFSGTGNSLLLSRNIASKIVGAELLPAVSLYCGTSKKIEADAVGFIFPVYSLDIPDLIKDLIIKNDFKGVGYFFAAVTCGGNSGNTLNSLDRKLRAKGKKLNWGIEVKVGDNSIVYTTTQEKLAQRLAGLEGISMEIATMVNRRETTGHAYKFKASSVFMMHAINIALIHYFKIDRKSVVKEKCSQCGLCEKVCPVRNIKVATGNVEWNDNCKWCFACLNWCPEKAIRFGRIELSQSQQYRCPGICAADIIDRGNKESNLDGRAN